MNAKLAQLAGGQAEPSDVRLLNTAVNTLQKHPRVLRFPKLDISSLDIRRHADVDFSRNEHNSSQIWIVIILCEFHGKAFILHYA